MDAVSGLLDGPRAREAFLLRGTFSAPWSLGVRDEAPLTIMAMTRGSAWLDAEGTTCALTAGDVAVVQGPAAYVMGSDLGRAPDAVILPGQRCAAPHGGEQDVFAPQGLRSWGNAAAGETELLIGTYTVAREVSQRLLHALPTALVLRAADWDSPLPALLRSELGTDAPGQDAVLDRLLDLLLVAALRTWLARGPAPDWWAAHDDPVAGPALAAMQAAPERAWTLAELAALAGVSRATFARRFTEAVGQPAMAFLTDWRLRLAADQLRESDDTVAAVARRVGYGSPYALSTAFTRRFGVSPREHRRG